MQQFNFIAIIIAGLTTGGLTCFAVQGGLLASLLGKQNIAGDKKQLFINNLKTISSFITAKILVYTLLGYFLGLLGSVINFNTTLQGLIQLFAAVYMIGIALQLLNLHPIFRYLIFQPPHSLQRLVRKISKNDQLQTTPYLLGFSTIFIPCGTTLAIEALAVSTNDPVLGAATMFIFTLTSSWAFYAIGLTSSVLSSFKQSVFPKITATLLILLGIISFNGGLNILGSPYSLDFLSGLTGVNYIADNHYAKIENGVQKVKIEADARGYQADSSILKAGVPVELKIKTHDVYSCASAFTIPSIGITRLLPTNGEQTITFTPTKKGTLAYSCSMGMYRSEFKVE